MAEEEIKVEKESTKRKQQTTMKSKERNAPKMEVDLHINQLVKSAKGMTNHEMLNLQMEQNLVLMVLVEIFK